MCLFHILSIRLSVNGHLRCFHFLAIASHVITTVAVQISIQTLLSFLWKSTQKWGTLNFLLAFPQEPSRGRTHPHILADQSPLSPTSQPHSPQHCLCLSGHRGTRCHTTWMMRGQFWYRPGPSEELDAQHLFTIC